MLEVPQFEHGRLASDAHVLEASGEKTFFSEYCDMLLYPAVVIWDACVSVLTVLTSGPWRVGQAQASCCGTLIVVSTFAKWITQQDLALSNLYLH